MAQANRLSKDSENLALISIELSMSLNHKFGQFSADILIMLCIFSLPVYCIFLVLIKQFTVV